MRMNVPSGLQGTWVRNFCLGCGLFGHIFEKRNIKLHAKSDEWVPRYINIPFVDVFSHDAEMVRSSEWWPLSKLILSLAQKDNLFRAGNDFSRSTRNNAAVNWRPRSHDRKGVAIGCHRLPCRELQFLGNDSSLSNQHVVFFWWFPVIQFVSKVGWESTSICQ